MGYRYTGKNVRYKYSGEKSITLKEIIDLMGSDHYNYIEFRCKWKKIDLELFGGEVE